MMRLSYYPDACSGVAEFEGGGKYCKHGHAFTYGCLGIKYPKGYPNPVCIHEHHVFDEVRKVIIIKQWVGQ
jgi:hypothetical protein